jgi:hypothetical protein
MQRLKPTGSHLLSPSSPPAELASALRRLGVSDAFNDAEVDELYCQIAAISGFWAANEESKEGPQVAKTLLAVANSQDVASAALSGHETGFHSTGEIHATSLIAQNLAPDSNEDAQQVIAKFSVPRIAEAALTAREKLLEKSDRTGREALVWYYRFTQLLLDIAKKAAVEPTFGNDSINDMPCGWLFTAASELEAFLYPDMRSPTPAACGKRLSRSLNRLGQARGPNAPSAA